MISAWLTSPFTGGYIAGAIMTAAEHWKLEGWRRWGAAALTILLLWIAAKILGGVLASAGL